MSGIVKAQPVREDEIGKGGRDLPVAEAVGEKADAESFPAMSELLEPKNSLARAGEPVEFWRPVFKASKGVAGVKEWLVHLERDSAPARVLFVHEDGTCDIEVEVEGQAKPDVQYRVSPIQLRPAGEKLPLRAWFQPGTLVLCAQVRGTVDEHSPVRRGRVVNLVHRQGTDFVDIQYDNIKDHVEFYVPLEAVGLNWAVYSRSR